MEDVTTETAPEKIWLQIDTDADSEDRDESFPTDFEGVTWHSGPIGGVEVEYVRADLVRDAIDLDTSLMARVEQKWDLVAALRDEFDQRLKQILIPHNT